MECTHGPISFIFMQFLVKSANTGIGTGGGGGGSVMWKNIAEKCNALVRKTAKYRKVTVLV